MSDTPRPLRRALLVQAADPKCSDSERERIVRVLFKALDADYLLGRLVEVRRLWEPERYRAEELIQALIDEDEKARAGAPKTPKRRK